jgi:hypothetical protein
MRFLDQWATRRFRQLYAQTLAVRDDPRGLAFHLRNAFNHGSPEPYEPVWATSVISTQSWDGWNGDFSKLSPRHKMRVAAAENDALVFYVRNPRTKSVFAVYVVNDEPPGDTPPVSEVKARWQAQERQHRIERLSEYLADDFESLVDEHVSPVTGMVDRDQVLRLMADAFSIGRHRKASPQENP